MCEEAWNDPEFWPRRLYPSDPVADMAAQGVDLFINISSSPFEMGKAAIRRDMIRQHAARHRVPFLYLNQVGGNDELIFDGHSLGFDADGAMILRADDFEEAFVVVDVLTPARGGAGSAQHRSPEIARVSESREEEAWHALRLGLRDYVCKCGFTSVVLGLSGGIDSALTAALAADALGPSHVTGIAMPTRYSSDHSLRDAEALARNLGIGYHVVAHRRHLPELSRRAGAGAARPTGRGRGKHPGTRARRGPDGVLEQAWKPVALHGQQVGAGRRLLHALRRHVRRAGRHQRRAQDAGVRPGALREPRGPRSSPSSSITKPPSAELRPNQTDQDTLPPYEVIDAIVEGYVERGLDGAALVAQGLAPAVVADVIGRIDRNEYKRRQAAPGLRITSKAFGVGRRFPDRRVVRDSGLPTESA